MYLTLDDYFLLELKRGSFSTIEMIMNDLWVLKYRILVQWMLHFNLVDI